MKKVFVVVVEDFGAGVLDSTIVLHIRAEGTHSAIRCARETLVSEFFLDDETIEDDLDLYAFELKENNIYEA
jgi:hypothetical protein